MGTGKQASVATSTDRRDRVTNLCTRSRLISIIPVTSVHMCGGLKFIGSNCSTGSLATSLCSSSVCNILALTSQSIARVAEYSMPKAAVLAHLRHVSAISFDTQASAAAYCIQQQIRLRECWTRHNYDCSMPVAVHSLGRTLWSSISQSVMTVLVEEKVV